MTRAALRVAAHQILRAGLEAVEPACLVRMHLQFKRGAVRAAGRTSRPKRVFVVSVGKAAAAMARAAHRILGASITRAIVITPQPAPRMAGAEMLVAGHPIPNAASVRAGRQVMELLELAERGDLVLLLLSGGSSALMAAPIEGVSLREKQRVTSLLLRRGANIEEVNAVRKQVSQLKGGGFARLAAPARVLTLALSDVPGDRLATIGSGPTIEDPRSRTVARSCIRRFLTGDEIPTGLGRALRSRTRNRLRSELEPAVVIGSGRTFAAAALLKAQELGFHAQVLTGALQGEARVCGPRLVDDFMRRRKRKPLCLIAIGETVVRVRGKGRGGRNQEVALSAVPALGRAGRPTVLAAFATDGVDGRSRASGGLVDDGSSKRAEAAGLSIENALRHNDSNTALRKLQGLLRTGPTGTNVADVTVVLG